MSELPPLIRDLAYILVVAGCVSLLFKKLRQPIVLGYIVAGFVVSPQMPYTPSVVDDVDVRIWADIGVIFLLFALGLEFSFKKIVRMGIAPVVTSCFIVVSMTALGSCVGALFGWSGTDCIFLGGMLAMSSTTIIYKAFADLSLKQQHFASLVMSTLILEDILAIAMMMALAALAGSGDGTGRGLWEGVCCAAVFVALWFAGGLWLIPSFLRKARHIINSETLLVISLGLCFLMAALSVWAGFSSAFGAFVMGSILAETVEGDDIARIVEPVKNLFGAIFFVSVGMLVEPQVLVDYAVPVVVLVMTVLMGQALFGTAGYMLARQPLRTAMRCGFSMAQIGEFAFIIASLGQSLGVTSAFLYPVVVAVSVTTTFLTPYMIRAAVPCYDALARRLPDKAIAALNSFAVASATDETDTREEQPAAALYKRRLIDRNVHIAELNVPADSRWAGKTLSALKLREDYGVLVCAIRRGNRQIGIPDGSAVLFPDDKLYVVGDDAQVTVLYNDITNNVFPSSPALPGMEMKLRRITVTARTPFVGKTLRDSDMRGQYNCMAVGLEQGGESITTIDPDRPFAEGDIVWMAGEADALDKIEA